MQKFSLMNTLERALEQYRRKVEEPDTSMLIMVNGEYCNLVQVSVDHLVLRNNGVVILFDRSAIKEVAILEN